MRLSFACLGTSNVVGVCADEINCFFCSSLDSCILGGPIVEGESAVDKNKERRRVMNHMEQFSSLTNPLPCAADACKKDTCLHCRPR